MIFATYFSGLLYAGSHNNPIWKHLMPQDMYKRKGSGAETKVFQDVSL